MTRVNGQLSLNLPLTAIKTSLLALSVAADDLQLVVNRSPAAIAGARVCTYDGAICGGFQAMATQGYLEVEVRNSGFLPADYVVTVVNCSEGVRPIQASPAGPEGRIVS